MADKFFCNLKWDMAYLNLSDQTISQCCKCDVLGYQIPDQNNIIDIFNHPHLLNERKDIIDGIIPNSCKDCVESEKIGVLSQNLLLKERADIFYSTPILSKLPKRIDFALHNFCNLTCVYCGPISSSSWTKDLITHGDYKSIVDIISLSDKDIIKNKIPLTSYAKSKTFSVINSIINHPDFVNVEKITLLGGEPLVNPFLLDIISAILNKNKTLKLDITTGLGVPDKTFVQVIEKLQELDVNRQLIINVSGEATGNIFEFIRYGISWQDWTKRLDLLIDAFGISQIRFSAVLFILNLSDFLNFLEYLNSKGIDTKSIQFSFLFDPYYLSLKNFDYELFRTDAEHLLASDLLGDDLRGNIQSLKLISKNTDKKIYQIYNDYMHEFAARRHLDINIFPQSLRNLHG